MTPPEQEDFQNFIEKQNRELEKLRAAFEEQGRQLAEIKQEFEALNIDTSKLPPLESLPPELRSQYDAFARDLKQLDELISPPRPKSKGAKIGRRAMI